MTDTEGTKIRLIGADGTPVIPPTPVKEPTTEVVVDLLHLGKLEVGNVGLFSLINGMLLIGEIDKCDGEYILLKQPFRLSVQHPSPGSTKVSIGLIPYGAELMFPYKPAYAFLVNHIMQGVKCPPDIEKQYRSSRSGLHLT